MGSSRRRQRWIAVCVLASGLIGAAFIVLGAAPRILHIEAPQPVALAPLPIVSETIESAPANPLELVAQNLMATLIERASASEGNNLTPDEVVAEALNQDFLESELARLMGPAIDSSDIRVTESDDTETVRRYFENFVAVLGRRLADLSIAGPSDMAPDEFEEIASRYEQAFDDLMTLVVPRELAAVHEEELRILAAKAAIFSAFSRYEDDPLPPSPFF